MSRHNPETIAVCEEHGTSDLSMLLAELDAKVQRMTKLPWHAATNPHPVAVRNRTEGVGVYGPDCQIYFMARDYGALPETFERQRADAEAIVALVNAWPALKAGIEQLQRERNRLHRMVCDARQYIDPEQHAESRSMRDEQA